MDTHEVDLVIAALYEAAADPSYWTNSLSLLTRAVGGLASVFVFADLRTPGASFVASTDGFSADAVRQYNEYYGAIDATRLLAERLPTGHIICVDDHFDERYVAGSEYYNDFLIPQGGRHVVGTRLLDDDRLKVVTSIHRNRQQGPFGPEELTVVRRIYPHLMQATGLAARFNRLRTEHLGLVAALDRVPWGIVIVGPDYRVARANAAASALFVKGDGLKLRDNKLEAEKPETTQSLQKLIREAASASRGRGGEPGGSIAITRPSDGGRLMAFVAPLSEAGGISLGVAAPGAIVFIADPTTRPIAPKQAIAHAFGLTPAETRLAVALASGDSLEEIADRHGLSKNTVRVQLQSVFAKTRTRRQAELATLVLGLPVVHTRAP